MVVSYEAIVVDIDANGTGLNVIGPKPTRCCSGANARVPDSRGGKPREVEHVGSADSDRVHFEGVGTSIRHEGQALKIGSISLK